MWSLTNPRFPRAPPASACPAGPTLCACHIIPPDVPPLPLPYPSPAPTPAPTPALAPDAFPSVPCISCGTPTPTPGPTHVVEQRAQRDAPLPALAPLRPQPPDAQRLARGGQQVGPGALPATDKNGRNGIRRVVVKISFDLRRFGNSKTGSRLGKRTKSRTRAGCAPRMQDKSLRLQMCSLPARDPVPRGLHTIHPAGSPPAATRLPHTRQAPKWPTQQGPRCAPVGYEHELGGGVVVREAQRGLGAQLPGVIVHCRAGAGQEEGERKRDGRDGPSCTADSRARAAHACPHVPYEALRASVWENKVRAYRPIVRTPITSFDSAAQCGVAWPGKGWHGG